MYEKDVKPNRNHHHLYDFQLELKLSCEHPDTTLHPYTLQTYLKAMFSSQEEIKEEEETVVKQIIAEKMDIR